MVTALDLLKEDDVADEARDGIGLLRDDRQTLALALRQRPHVFFEQQFDVALDERERRPQHATDVKTELVEFIELYNISEVDVNIAGWYFSDGITEDLTADLSQISDLFVISRNTAFTYKGKPVKLSEDLVLDARLAAEASERIRGGDDFGRVAAEYSDGAAASEGGHVGIIRQGDMDSALETVAFSLKPGGVSDIIQTAGGFHIIKVEERMAGDTPSAEAREQIRQRVFLEKLRQRLDAYLAELKQKAYMQVSFAKSFSSGLIVHG